MIGKVGRELLLAFAFLYNWMQIRFQPFSLIQSIPGFRPLFLFYQQAKTGSATTKMWAVLSFVVAQSENETEVALLKSEIECGQFGATVISEKMKYAELPEGKVDLNLLNSMSKSFDRFLAHCQKLHNMGRIKMGGLECSFRDMLTNPDDEINCHRINFAHGISEKMTSLIAAMDDLMSPAAKWKDSLTEAQAQASEVASVIAVAETTVMQVKGKKLHNQTQLLMQARLSNLNLSRSHLSCSPLAPIAARSLIFT